MINAAAVLDHMAVKRSMTLLLKTHEKFSTISSVVPIPAQNLHVGNMAPSSGGYDYSRRTR